MLAEIICAFPARIIINNAGTSHTLDFILYCKPPELNRRRKFCTANIAQPIAMAISTIGYLKRFRAAFWNHESEEHQSI